jgi:hypothetical protein
MQIVVHGKSDKLEVNFFKDVILFFNKLLLNNEKKIKVDLYLISKYKNKNQRFGLCNPIISTWFTLTTPRVYAIEMDAALNQRTAGITLAHEFVHIEQMYLGLLKIPPYYPLMTWLGHPLDPNKDEDEQPFEIEARGREQYLYEKFLEHSDRLAA